MLARECPRGILIHGQQTLDKLYVKKFSNKYVKPTSLDPLKYNGLLWACVRKQVWFRSHAYLLTQQILSTHYLGQSTLAMCLWYLSLALVYVQCHIMQQTSTLSTFKQWLLNINELMEMMINYKYNKHRLWLGFPLTSHLALRGLLTSVFTD